MAERLHGYVDGFPRDDFARLKRLADDLQLSAVLAGHIHETDRWSWTLGERTKVRVMGRSGGMNSRPKVGFLEISGRNTRWRTGSV